MRAGSPFVHDLRLSDDRRQRQTISNALGAGHNIRLDAVRLPCEHIAGTPESGLDLVKNQHDAVFVTDFTHVLYPFARRYNVAALALYRLHQNRRNRIRVDQTLENIIKLSEVLLRAFAVFHLVRSAEQLGVFGKINGGDKTFVMLAVRRIGGCERGAHHRAPMEGTLECNDCRTLGCILGQLDRALDGFCTGVGEVNLIAAAHQTDNALRKSGLLLIVEQIVAAVHHLIKLLVRRLDNSRIIMAEVVYCDAAAKIQDFAAVIRIQVAAGGMIDTERHLVQRKGRHNSSRTFIQIRHDNFLLNQSSNVWFSQ